MTTLKMKTKNARTVREWRAYRRLTKADVARAIGVYPSTYASMENRPSDISMRMGDLISEVFECSTDEINFFE